MRVSFYARWHTIRQCEVVEVIRDGKLLCVIYPTDELTGVRVISKYGMEVEHDFKDNLFSVDIEFGTDHAT